MINLKFRESGMPDESYWNTFFDPLAVLKDFGLQEDTDLIVDVGSGYGTFAIPAASYIKGKVIGLDIEKDMVDICKTKANNLGIENTDFLQTDVFTEGMCLPIGSVDCVFLFNILHCEKPLDLLNKTYSSLKKGGKVFVMHWIFDINTPRGPSMDIRPKPEQIIDLASQTNFTYLKQIDIKPYHYGLILEK